MRVSLNLATRPFADMGPALKRIRIGMLALVVLAIAFAVGLHFMHNAAEAARAREHSLDGAIASVTQERQGYENMVRLPDNAEVLAKVSALNKVIDAKSFSWTLAMEDLETVLPGGVQVTTLEPTVDKKDGHITVRLRVIGPRDKAVELVQNLEHSRRFMQPRIVGETMESSGNGTQQVEPVSASNRVNFDLLADYNPPTPDERKSANKKTQAEATPEAAPAEAQPAAPRAGRPGRQRAPYTGPKQSAPAKVQPGGAL